MTSGTDRAREMLGASRAGPRHYCNLLALAIKQHEALRGEHRDNVVKRVPGMSHWQAITEQDYTESSLTCAECAVLLQWEQMWEERE